eukprot:4173794-Pleurochrysis_carterae.AAC.1
MCTPIPPLDTPSTLNLTARGVSGRGKALPNNMQDKPNLVTLKRGLAQLTRRRMQRGWATDLKMQPAASACEHAERLLRQMAEKA